MADPIKHGWWSDNQVALSHGYSVYRTPDGRQVKVSTVTNDRNDHGTKWHDIRYVGEVTTWVRNEAEWSIVYKSHGATAMVPPIKPKVPEPIKADPALCKRKYYGIDCNCPKCRK